MAVVDDVIAREGDSGKEIWVTEFGYDACTVEAMDKRTGWFEKLDWQGYDDVQQAQYLFVRFCYWRPVMLIALIYISSTIRTSPACTQLQEC